LLDIKIQRISTKRRKGEKVSKLKEGREAVTKVKILYRKMKKIIKSIIVGFALISFALLGGPVFAEETTNNEEELRERLDMLIEKAKELVKLAQELEEKGQLPLATTKTECDLYLESYIQYGAENDEQEVEKLQRFLNDYMEKDIPVTGFYGDITMSAVKELQSKHAAEILTPWGIAEPTGYVYKTTQRFINNIKCPGVTLPMPESLDADLTSGEVEGAEAGRVGEVRGDETVGETPTEGVDVDEEGLTDEEMEEEAEEDNDEEEEREENRNLTWAILAIAAIGLGVTLYHIYNFNSASRQRVE
jgi:hypothetical protein